MTVLVIGDANVDLEIVLPAAADKAPHSNPKPRMFGGGSAANTAATLASLGVACRFVGSVGDDEYGRVATRSLSDAGVDVSGVSTTRDEPTVMVVVVVPPDGERLIYVWPPTGGAQRALTRDQAIASVTGADALHVSGLCLRVVPARDSIIAAMEHARRIGIPVSFDLNLRLENWGWDDGFRSVVEQAVAHSDIILGSGNDEIVPLADENDITTAAHSIAGAHRLVVARMGAGGALACTGGTVVTSPSFHADVVDTVGAGDAFNAGFLLARGEGADLGVCLQWGNAVAAIAIAERGARSLPMRATVEQLIESGRTTKEP